MSNNGKHAIVLGASGLIGWAVVDQLLRTQGFAKVTAVTNRPVHLAETHWPSGKDAIAELQLVSGIDLGGGDGASLAEMLRRDVRGVEGITHIFYFVFTSMGGDDLKEVAVNRGMLQNVVDAIDILRAPLKFVVFPGGTRGYGIYIPGGTFKAPLTEDMVNSLPPDYAKTVVYPSFREVLTTASKGKGWTWCEVCPDAIISFTPNGSQFSLALHWAHYLSLYANNHGAGTEVQFPGIEPAYDALCTPVSARTIARFAIYASLHPSTCGGGQLFNVGDRDTPATFREMWSRLAAWFGLKGVGPGTADPAAVKGDELPGRYIEKYKGVFEERGLGKAAKAGVGAGSTQLDSVGTWLTFDRDLSLQKLRDVDFGEERDPVTGLLEAFEGFKAAGLIL
ncbi:hypothetical protein BJ170DRAFT_418903 [Xylariales sp. AK1849]|nr:hypothetical protein BJ170DRAFT_418903 [Xylariales sp. AK1849]